MTSITFGVLSTLNGANAERLVRDFAILISYMVGLNESLCFGEKNVFPVCNKSSKDIYILIITIWTLMYHIWTYISIQSLASSTSRSRSLLTARFTVAVCKLFRFTKICNLQLVWLNLKTLFSSALWNTIYWWCNARVSKSV